MKKILFAMISVLAVSCGPTVPLVDGGVDSGVSDECASDDQCPDQTFFTCNTTTAKCEPACRSKADCTVGRRGAAFALAYCDNSSLGCECDEGKCIGTLCSSDSECGTQVCRNGACVAAPATSEVTKCTISPDFVVLRSGAKAKFFVSAWKAGDAPLVVKEGATWTAVGTSMTGSGTGISQEFTAATATTGTVAVDGVQAAFGSINCKAKVIVLPAAAEAGKVAVVAVDELSGRPIKMADVVVSTEAGVIVAQGANMTVKTDDRGFASADIAANAKFSVTVFHPDYTYTTVANYTGMTRYLSVVMRRNQVDKYGGFKGTMTKVVQKDIQAAITGMSLAGSITNLSITQLLGPSVPTDVVVGTTINQKGVPIPAGVFLGFNTNSIKPGVAGQGLAGTCLGADGNPDEVAIASGSCGTRSAWSLGGNVPLGELTNLIPLVQSGVTGSSVANVLAGIIPIFKRFNSTVTRDVKFSLVNAPFVADGGTERDLKNQGHFTALDQEFAQVPLAFNFAVKLPELPKFNGLYIDGAAVIGGSIVPGRGVVPLGLGVAANVMPVDGQTDVQVGLPSAGLVSMRMAPNHHGIEGSEYGLVVAGVSAASITNAAAGVGASSLFARIADNKLKFDPKGVTPVDLSTLKFPAYPETGRFNFSDVLQPGIAARSFRFKTVPDFTASGVSVIRVSFADDLEHRWDVIMNPSDAATGFTLPVPPNAIADRTKANSTVASERSTLLVQAIRLNSNPSTGLPGNAISFNGLVELNDTNAERTTEFLTGFSFLDFGKPKVEFTKPEASPATVAKASKLEFTVSNFKLGLDGDGQVKVTFATAGGLPVVGCDAVTTVTEVMVGNGKVELTLPATCVSATAMKVKAELVTIAGLPIVPAASTTIDLIVTP